MTPRTMGHLPVRAHLRPPPDRSICAGAPGAEATLIARVDPATHVQGWTYDYVCQVPLQVANAMLIEGEA